MSAGASLGEDIARAIDVSRVETPVYITDLGALEANLRILADVQARAGCTILLALKGFAQWSTFPLVRRYLAGATASSVAEARLAKEELGGQVHAYAPAYSDGEMRELVTLADHVVLNSPAQWRKHRHVLGGISCGLRVNHEHQEVEVALYDPAGACSRLGTTRANLTADDLDGLDGLHFHTLCQKNSDALARALAAFEAKFGDFIPRMKWVNFGGGHHITRPDYDRELLVRLVLEFRARHPHVHVYLEPGEAIALGTGVLVASVMDTFVNGMPIAILDTSATAHMPDVLEMPYRPVIVGAGEPGAKPHTYRLGGMTCLAGDVIGDYSFDAPLREGDKLVFLDMAHYTMVKTTTFNGVRLPAIATHANGTITVHKRFGYRDYRDRLLSGHVGYTDGVLRLAPLVAVAACAKPPPPVPPEVPPTAAELVHRIEQAYATAQTYVDHGDSATVFTGELAHTSHLTFDTVFRRSGGFRFTYLKDGDRKQPFVIWSANNRDAVTHWYARPDEPRTSTLDLAIAAATGLSSRVASTVPSALLERAPIVWPELAMHATVTAETLRGTPCWKIAGTRDNGDPAAFWIDRRTSLVRQIETRHHFTREALEQMAASTRVPGPSVTEPFDTVSTTTYEPARDIALSSAQVAELVADRTVMPRDLWLGVTLRKGGHAIDRVFGGSPAEAAGLQPGDELESLDGKPVASLRDVHAALADREPRARLVAHVRRGGAVLDLPIVLAVKPTLGELARGLVGKPAPDFAITTTTGVDVSLASLRGKVIVLDFWATWCVPCEITTPIVNALAAKYPSAAVIGLSSEDAATIAKSQGHAYTLALDPDDKVAATYLVQGIPQFVVIDSQGVVRFVGASIAGARDLDAQLASLKP